jgi:hypothetical protein
VGFFFYAMIEPRDKETDARAKAGPCPYITVSSIWEEADGWLRPSQSSASSNLELALPYPKLQRKERLLM